jgi:dTDP-4-dehydrorhamnose reductase
MLGHDLMEAFHDEDFIAYAKEDLDITNKEDVFERLITVAPDVVINATGFTNVDEAESMEERANMINGYAVGVLARACREIGATFVHFSTDYVFPGVKKGGYGEEDGTGPINAYGRSKLLGEKLLVEEMELQDQTIQNDGSYFLIRTSWLYGAHGKNFVDTMLKLGNEKEMLKVVNDQHGKPTYTKDLCEQVKWLISTHDYPAGIYHVSNEGATTWFDFAKEIFRLAKNDIDVIPCTSAEYPRPATRPAYSALVNSKLPPLRNWKEALKEYMSVNGALADGKKR